MSEVRHGIDCPKQPHLQELRYLHDESDDGPYDVDGCVYCGRCHVYIGGLSCEVEARKAKATVEDVFICQCECGGSVLGRWSLGRLFTVCDKCTPTVEVRVPRILQRNGDDSGNAAG